MNQVESTENLTQEDVKSFLRVYTIGRERRQILEDRRQHIINELRVAFPGPLDAGSDLAKIEVRLIAQRQNMAVLMLKVLDLVDLLPLPLALLISFISDTHLYPAECPLDFVVGRFQVFQLPAPYVIRIAVRHIPGHGFYIRANGDLEIKQFIRR